MNNVQCKGEIRPAGRFHDWNDYDDFVRKLKCNPLYIPIPVAKSYLDVGFVEEWYRCLECQAIWRLVEPDPPFNGLWEKVAFDTDQKNKLASS